MDDNLPILENQMFVTVELPFKAIRVTDRQLTPVKFKVATELYPSDEDEPENYQTKVINILAKLRYFVDNVLDGSLLLAGDNEWALEAFLDEDGNPVANNVIMMPDGSTTACLAALLQSKFRALANGGFDFTFVQVKASDSKGLAFTFVGDGSLELPEMADWVGELNYFSKPWWERDDASTLDVCLLHKTLMDEEVDLDNPPKFAYSLSFLTQPGANEDTEQKVVRPEFRPRVIEGGKAD